ncbi:aldehyde dehydrogenase family protein [Aliiglaciecola lipolytica]|nr:aldehyde dehydrogenase family protein [Aliiglaciecola lipolytica]
MLDKSQYIAGKIVKGPVLHEVINPATGLKTGVIHAATANEANNALIEAQKCFVNWSSTAVAERVEWMMKLKQAIINNEHELRMCVHLEMGKSWSSTQGDYQMLIDSLDYYADLISNRKHKQILAKDGKTTHTIMDEPIGVVAAFLAWNFPLLNLAYKLGPAMAAGCPIVIKPSIKTPLSACLIGELCASINLPAGAVSIVCGDDIEIGDAISTSTIPALITLIGSTEVGKHVIAKGSTSIKKYSMELGGNAPVLVMQDADIELAADIVATLKTENAGQICVAPNRIFVHKDVHDQFVEALKSKFEAKNVGFDREEDIDMGPVMDTGAWSRIDGLVKKAVHQGATVVTGGGRPEGLLEGSFYAPTLLTGVTNNMDICRNEIFGPVASIIAFDELSEVITQANDTDAGLSSYIFTENYDVANKIARQLRFGEVHINSVNYAINLPHCGLNQSGVGVDCSELALDDYFATKRISALKH